MKYYVQLFTVDEETGDSHIRVWEVDEESFNGASNDLQSHTGRDADMEAIVPAERAQLVADVNEENAVIFNG